MNSYEELLETQQKQVDATIANIRRNVWPSMDSASKSYLREHIANCALTCAILQRKEERKERDRRFRSTHSETIKAYQDNYRATKR